MATFSLKFYGAHPGETSNNTLEFYVTTKNVIYFKIQSDTGEQVIHLDKSTAIKVTKELKRQISYIKDDF